jgi:gamma-glutamylcyclotransferase (GGCT)/AIG2-like uncharacterized protein YtfP
MPPLFAYGTLMCEDIMLDVSGWRLAQIGGALIGYSRRRVRGKGYPGLIQSRGGRTEGVIYLGLSDDAWRRLDRFEGDMYARQPVSFERNTGDRLTADTYVARLEYLDRLEESDWDFEEFLRGGKERFTAGYEGFKALRPGKKESV